MSIAYTPRGRFVVYDKILGGKRFFPDCLLSELHQRRHGDSRILQCPSAAGESRLYSDTDVRGS